MCNKLWECSKTVIVLYDRKKSLIRWWCTLWCYCVKCPLLVGCVTGHLYVMGPQGSSCRCPDAGWVAQVAAADKSKSGSVPGISWRERNWSFHAEWACCSALLVCMEFRWEIERFFLLPSGFLTTINLSGRAINIKFPPVTVSLSCKCSGQTVRKAEFMATLAGGGKGGFVWSPNNLLWFKKKKPSEHAEQNLILRFKGSFSYHT